MLSSQSNSLCNIIFLQCNNIFLSVHIVRISNIGKFYFSKNIIFNSTFDFCNLPCNSEVIWLYSKCHDNQKSYLVLTMMISNFTNQIN